MARVHKTVANSNIILNFQNRKECYLLILKIIISVIMFFFIGKKGVVLERDTAFYMDWDYASTIWGYKCYASFLHLFSFTSDDTSLMRMAFIMQSLFSMLSIIICDAIIKKRICNLKIYEDIITYLFMFLPYCYSLPEVMANHYMLSESLAIPLFSLYFTILFYYLTSDSSPIYFVFSLVLSIVLSTTRSQFVYLIFFTILIGVAKLWYRQTGGLNINNKVSIKLCIVSIITVIIVYTSIYIIVITALQNRKLPDQLNAALSGKALTLMTREDITLFGNTHQECMEYVFERTMEEGNLGIQCRNNTWKAYDYAHSIQQNTKFFAAYIYDYLKEKGIDSIDGMGGYHLQCYYSSVLLGKHWYDYHIMSATLLLQSLVTSFSYQPDSLHEICHYCACIMILAYIVLLIIEIKNRTDKNVIAFATETIILLLINAIFVSIIFYGQQRYLIYTFGFLYLSWYMLIKGYINNYVVKNRAAKCNH